ncbi:MAG: alpha-amylase family glycosyl hydrolase [Bradymonadales bacterium]|jgi:cyclomaltodextrinase
MDTRCLDAVKSSLAWFNEAVFYHVYALGMLGCEKQNDFGAVRHRLGDLDALIPYWESLGVNAILIGPICSSSRHGYDTAEFFRIDERLGDNDDFARFVQSCHHAGIRVIVDAVFNHVGRDFWAFRDVKQYREHSAYCDYFCGLNFTRNNASNDGFSYETWEGHEELVKLNLSNPKVREHLFLAVEHWMRDYKIDGLRLDAADCLDPNFIRELRVFCKSRRPDFYLVGEVIHGDYRQWANADMLDGTTNYEAYKGLWSSQNDGNYHEIAWTLKREFAQKQGIYENLAMLSFADNHDVARLASVLKDEDDIFAVYSLLFSMPGVPCIYYASEWGMRGKKLQGYEADDEIRKPVLAEDLAAGRLESAHPQASALRQAVARLAHFRRRHKALSCGSYTEWGVSARWLVFSRSFGGEELICAISGEAMPCEIDIAMPSGDYVDILNGGELRVEAGRARMPLYPKWLRVWRRR